jgi:3-phenylpropionate/trans-cinnamate dioxygenase ferredoxin component
MPTIDVCAEGEIPEGGHRLVDLGGGIEAAVFFVEGEYHAIEDLCTHDDGPLAEGELDGCQVICPRHGARFDIRTGEALSLPAYRPVEAFKVRCEAGRVLLEA